MKKAILLFSAGSAATSTMVAVAATALSSDPSVLTRALASAGYIGLLSIASFFVGLVFPKQ